MPEIFNLLKDLDKNFDMPELVNFLIKNGFSVSAFPIHEYWMDIGRMSDYTKAEEDLKKLT